MNGRAPDPSVRADAVAPAETPATLLLIGIHREELAFGSEVAETLTAGHVDLLTIPQGISGRRPRPDQHFQYATLHRALYLQLLPHVVGHYRLLIDLHTGEDSAGPSADLFCADAALRRRLEAGVAAEAGLAPCEVRVVALDGRAELHARTVIPPQVWSNPAFLYVGIEIYLPAGTARRAAGRALASRLVRLAAACVHTPAGRLT